MDLPLVSIRLAGEPQGKGRPRFVRQTGRVYTPAKTERYESELRLAAQDAMGRRVPYEGALAVTVRADMPIPQSWSGKKQRLAADGLLHPTKKPDADNFAKGLDALNSIVFRDDAQVVDLRVVKRYSTRPAMTIEVFATGGTAV